MDDLSRLLLRFDVFTRIKRVRKAGYRDGWHLHVYRAEYQRPSPTSSACTARAGRLLAPSGEHLRDVAANTNLDTVPREVWDRVRELLAEHHMTHRDFAAAMKSRFCGSTMWKHAPSRSRLARAAAVLHDADLDMLATNDVFWDRIVEKESLGMQEVFDATVPGTHSFVADGIILQNTEIEQDADMVILLHRPDAFERDDPRAGEADLIRPSTGMVRRALSPLRTNCTTAVSQTSPTADHRCSVSKPVSLSQIKCHPGVTSDRMLRLARLQTSAKNLRLGSPGTSSAEVRLDGAVVRITAVLVNPIGLGVPPTLAQPPGQLASAYGSAAAAASGKACSASASRPRPLAQPPGQPAAQRGWRQGSRFGEELTCDAYAEFRIIAIRWTAGLCALPGGCAW